MAGIYIHIPYCRKVCYYCDFHFTASFKDVEPVVQSVIREITDRKDYLNKEPVNTIYFGGGTPSAIDIHHIRNILDTVFEHYSVASDAEITLEANPDDLHPSWLKNLKLIGINRLSIGIQSFMERDLKWMNRRHSASKAIDSIRFARESGFDNINADLIYGIPGLSGDDWRSNLRQFFDLGIPHLSAYHLTIEPKTVFGVRKKRGELFEVSEDDSVSQFEILMKEASAHGYLHYEISNFAREGFLSRHNLGYWKDNLYLGAGPSAHSYNGGTRRWNTKIHRDYIRGVNLGNGYFEEEKLTTNEKYNDYILTHLRTMWGIDLTEIRKIFGESFEKSLMRMAEKYKGYLLPETDRIILNNKGKFLADRIASEFFVVEKD